jgi:hypothetical protein
MGRPTTWWGNDHFTISGLDVFKPPRLHATAWTTANTGGSAINTGLNNDNYGRGLLAEGCCHGGNA